MARSVLSSVRWLVALGKTVQDTMRNYFSDVKAAGAIRNLPAPAPTSPLSETIFTAIERLIQPGSDAGAQLQAIMLRRRPTMTASRRHSGRDGIIPLGVEFVAFDIEGGHFGVSDLDPLWIGPRIKLAAHPETGLGRRCGDQFDHGETTCQGVPIRNQIRTY
jgi:hypothetical protein